MLLNEKDLLYLSDHLRQVHGLSAQARQPWLKQASLLPPPVDLPVGQYPKSLPLSSCPMITVPDNNSPLPCLTDNNSNSPIHCLDTQPHPDFAFQHPYSMMVVRPSQCGKTHFVHQLLTRKCIAYPEKKTVRVVWCYSQWQPKYDEIERGLGSKIRFFQGVPELEDDLSEIKTSKHTIIVLDDLMAEAKDSPVVSKLFTQGRHRNASVILLLQNMFPKGKYNTDISRNATYKVLFRSPGDRKQIDIMAEQTFAKDRPRFMQAYHRETTRPYGYLVVDNHPRTTSEHQVVGNVLGDCYTYPHITSTLPPMAEFPRESLPPREPVQQPLAIKRKAPAFKKSEVKASKKRKVVPRRVPPKKRKSKSVTKKEPVHDSTSEEETPEEEDSDSEEGEGDGETYSDGEETDDEPDPEEEDEEEEGPREGETWNDYWNRLEWKRANSMEGTWHYPKNPINLRPPRQGIGVGSRIAYP